MRRRTASFFAKPVQQPHAPALNAPKYQPISAAQFLSGNSTKALRPAAIIRPVCAFPYFRNGCY